MEISATRSFMTVAKDPSIGVNQTAPEFYSRIVEEFYALTPETYQPGAWKDRNCKTVVNYLRDSIKAKCSKFNGYQLRVEGTQPSGCNEEQQVNMAYAL